MYFFTHLKILFFSLDPMQESIRFMQILLIYNLVLSTINKALWTNPFLKKIIMLIFSEDGPHTG